MAPPVPPAPPELPELLHLELPGEGETDELVLCEALVEGPGDLAPAASASRNPRCTA